MDYLDLYQTYRQALLTQRGMQATGYPNSVATTWSLSFQKVGQANPAAAELLQLCAFLAPDRIPEELIKEGAAQWPPSLQQAATDLFTFNQMLTDLLKFSLIKRSGDRTLSIHRLVQIVLMDSMDLEVQHQWAERIILAVNEIFPRNPTDITTWPQCLYYLDQAQVCQKLLEQYTIQFIEAADLLNRTGLYLVEHALYVIAEPLYRRALTIYEQQLGAEHPSTATSLNNLAGLYESQGKYSEAEPLYRRALAISEQQLGAEHPDVTYPLNGLANLYKAQGKYAQAEPLYQRILHIRKQQLGSVHPDLVYPLNGLANLYKAQGEYAQAEQLYQRALQISEQELGREHPLTQTLRENYTIFLQVRGHSEMAKKLEKDA